MIKVDVKNIKGVQNALSKYGKEGAEEFAKVTKIRALEIANHAKTLAAVDNGTMRMDIQVSANIENKGFSWTVGAYQPYSPFVEFGTGTLVDIPSGWGEMAAQFRGEGIKQINLQPRPFMYPAFVYGSKLYKQDLKDTVKYLNKKFNNG